MGIPHTDRMDYVAAATNNHAFCLTIEKLLGVEVPRRAQLIRVILDELQRLSSHLVWLGTSGIDLGRGDALLVRVPRARADPRLLRGVLRRAADPELHADRRPALRPDAGLDRAAVRSSSTTCPSRIDDYEQLLTDNRIWKKRTVGVGVISGEECIEWGLTGPILRASGVEWDLRRAQPYECYDELDFAIPTRVRTATPTTATSSACRRCARARASSASASSGSSRGRSAARSRA